MKWLFVARWMGALYKSTWWRQQTDQNHKNPTGFLATPPSFPYQSIDIMLSVKYIYAHGVRQHQRGRKDSSKLNSPHFQSKHKYSVTCHTPTCSSPDLNGLSNHKYSKTFSLFLMNSHPLSIPLKWWPSYCGCSTKHRLKVESTTLGGVASSQTDTQ